MADFTQKSAHDWLAPNHPARTGELFNASKKAVKNYSQFVNMLSDQQTVELLAAVVPNHCADGWTFLSQAISALLSGDIHTARHLAYYAQLRAALSFLGCNGIGIFNTINFAIDSRQKRHRLDHNNKNSYGLGTHEAVWRVLNDWSNELGNAKYFLESIAFRGVSVAENIDTLFPNTRHVPLICEIVKTWGVDLKNIAEDQNARNVSSYAVHALNLDCSDLTERLKLVRDLWYLLEPDGAGGFPSLDRYLLRNFFDLVVRNYEIKFKHRHCWSSSFLNLDPTTQQFVSSAFLERTDEPDDPVVFDYARDSNSSSRVHSMISRALMLLRVATLVVHSTLKKAGLDPVWSKLEPWLDSLGTTRGFWSKCSKPHDVMDLWIDVEVGVFDLDDALKLNPQDQCIFTNSMSADMLHLSQTERAFMWGVTQ